MEEYKTTFGELCEWIWNGKTEHSFTDRVYHSALEKFKDARVSEKDKTNLKEYLLLNFIARFSSRWTGCNRTKSAFCNKYGDWMKKPFIIDFKIIQDKTDALSRRKTTHCVSMNASSPCEGDNPPARELRNRSYSMPSTSNQHHFESSTFSDLRSVPCSRGRPKTPYEESSDRSKRRKNVQLRQVISEEQLMSITRNFVEKKNKLNNDEDSEEKLNIRNSALAMYIDLDFTKDKYVQIRQYNKMTKTSNKHYPAYNEIQKAKQCCYPEKILISEYGAKVDLQSLLNHTAKRLILSIQPEKRIKFDCKEIVLKCKWGMDGCSGQQNFKQAPKDNVDFYGSRDSNFGDSNVFIVSFSPLQLLCEKEQNILWQNPSPSSTKFCRPIEFQFMKESTEKTKELYDFYCNEISHLLPTNISIDEFKCSVSYDFQCTMIDGKTCNALTGQRSTTSCNVCKVSPKDMNNLAHVKALRCDENSFKFGLSTLHCWIRTMECVLHISYNLEFQKGSARGDDKELKLKKKKNVQQELKKELSLLVDMVKQGFGSTNDGNTARKFFSNVEIVSKITGVDRELIKNFSVILQLLASGREIDCNKFEAFCTKTAELYVKLYSWYPMPPTIHKMLIHGSNIIKSAFLPIGQLSEEAQEAGNKIFKKVRARGSRTCSRSANNEDIFHFLLIHSDPLISSLRRIKTKKISDLSPEAKLLIVSSLNESDEDS